MRQLRHPQVIGAVFLILLLGGLGLYLSQFITLAVAPSSISQSASAQTPQEDPFAHIDLLAKGVYVQDLKSDAVLYSRNPDSQLPLASLTKVPMAIVVSEVLSPDAAIKIPFDTAPKGSAERLAAGDIWKIRDILDFTLIASSNGGADILAQAADPLVHAKYPQSPSQNATLWRMNDLAQQLGMHHTYFINDNGLDESDTQSGAYGSAHDIATLFAYAARTWPDVFAGTTKDGVLLNSIHGANTSAFNTNDALGAIPGLIMGKTGNTDLAGGNLAIVFDVGPAHPVVAVVLGSTVDGRFEDMKKIVAATYAKIAQGD